MDLRAGAGRYGAREVGGLLPDAVAVGLAAQAWCYADW